MWQLVGCIALRAPPAQAQSQFSLTLTNPSPAAYDYFGYSVAAVSSDWVLIGAHRCDTGATDAGAAYLFTTDGTLLTTSTICAGGTHGLF